MVKTVSELGCNYQDRVSATEIWESPSMAQCDHCGIEATELSESGKTLEICGELFGIDMGTNERVISTIALCPECHKSHHLDADRKHQPCQILAAFSREGLV